MIFRKVSVVRNQQAKFDETHPSCKRSQIYGIIRFGYSNKRNLKVCQL